MLGTLTRLEGLKSAFFDVPTVEVWLPEEYDTSKQHPVIYMLDGQWLFDASLTWSGQAWEVDKSLSRLVQSGKIPPAIVVGIWHHENTRNTDYLPALVFESLPSDFQKALTNNGELKIKSGSLLKFIVGELKPLIDARFSTYKQAARTFIMGSSMGALLSLSATCEFPRVFGGAGCLSPHWCLVLDEGENPAPTAFVQYLEKHLPVSGKPKFYVDLGNGFFDNRNVPHQPNIDAVFRAKGYTANHWQSKVFDGHNHSEKFWSLRFPKAVRFLLGK